MAFIVALPHAAEASPSRASLNGLDGINFFNAAMLAGFGPYVAVYLAEQKWTQENIGFVLTASGLAGLLALMPGGELLDTVRSKRALAALGAIMVAVTALVIGIWPNFPVVFNYLKPRHARGFLLLFVYRQCRTEREVRRWSVSHGAPCGRRQGQVLTRRERAAAGRGVLP